MSGGVPSTADLLARAEAFERVAFAANAAADAEERRARGRERWAIGDVPEMEEIQALRAEVRGLAADYRALAEAGERAYVARQRWRETVGARLADLLPGVFVFDPEGFAYGEDLWRAYVALPEKDGRDRLTRRALFAYLESLGLEKRKRARGIVFYGARLAGEGKP